MLKDKISRAWYKLVTATCRVLSRILFRLKVEGRENVPAKGPFVIASNHQSFLDPVFCSIHLKRRLTFLARDTLFTHWFFGRLIRSLNAIPVKLGKGDISTMKEVVSRLKQGHGVCLFPEGTRCHDGKIATIKPGFGLLCRRGKATIVPTVIDGAFECWPRHQKIFSRGPVSITYGTPMPAEKVAKMKNKQLADMLNAQLQEMQSEIRDRKGKAPFDYTSEDA